MRSRSVSRRAGGGAAPERLSPASADADSSGPRPGARPLKQRRRIDAPPRAGRRAGDEEDSPNCTDLVVYNAPAAADDAGGLVVGGDGGADFAKILGERRQSMRFRANVSLKDSFNNVREVVKERLQELEDDVARHGASTLKLCLERVQGVEVRLAKQTADLLRRQEAHAQKMAEQLAAHREAIASVGQAWAEVEQEVDGRSKELARRVAEFEAEVAALISRTESDVRTTTKGMNNTGEIRKIINALL